MNEFLLDQAALYVSGAMLQDEREQFELVLEFQPELRQVVAGFAEAGTALLLGTQPAAAPAVPARLKQRITDAIDGRAQQCDPDGLVMSGPDGLVRWVNPAFSALCGYTLEELRGKKLGPILQGAATDPATAERMRRAVHQLRPCRETILNYHKCGDPYWVDVHITPILDGSGRPLWLVARERELPDRVAA